MSASFRLHCFKPSPVGGIGYELILSNAEIAMLQLLLAPDNQAFSYWEKFWQEIADYEDAPFGCKELMPLAVRKMQRTVSLEIWQSVAPFQATFLAGLPKYTWTKNRIIFQQFKNLSNQLTAMQIPVMAIKGMAEMLRDPQVMFMRTSRDIDLVIQPKDLEVSIGLFESLGWRSDQVADGIPFPLSDFDGNSFTFNHPEFFIDLDIHFDAVSDSRGKCMEFTQELWNTKHTLPGFEGLLSIPSHQNQFCLFLANAFVPDNWSTGLVNKYLYDLLRQLQVMDGVEKKYAQKQAQRFLEMGGYANQILNLSCSIDPVGINRSSLLNTSICLSCTRFLKGLPVSEDRYYQYWHLHNVYQGMKPFLIRRYGRLLSYIWIIAHFIFHLRWVQIGYWHLITWKDQAIDRIQYYFGRIIFYRKQYSLVYLLQKVRNNLKIKAGDLIINTAEPESSQDILAQIQSPVGSLVSSSSIEESDSYEEYSGAPFPLGMSRSFYLSWKLLKI